MAKWADKEAAIKALEREGRIDPKDLICAARDPQHRCHGDFTWDIEKAASERWHDQARHLIQRCKFEVIVEDVGPRSVSYFTPSGDGATFKALTQIRSPEMVSSVLLAEVAQLQGVASRVLGIAEAKAAMVGVESLNSLREVVGIIREVRQNLSHESAADVVGCG